MKAPDRYGTALSGNVHKGLFFRGAGRLPFGTETRPPRDPLEWLVGAGLPATQTVEVPAA